MLSPAQETTGTCIWFLSCVFGGIGTPIAPPLPFLLPGTHRDLRPVPFLCPGTHRNDPQGGLSIPGPRDTQGPVALYFPRPGNALWSRAISSTCTTPLLRQCSGQPPGDLSHPKELCHLPSGSLHLWFQALGPPGSPVLGLVLSGSRLGVIVIWRRPDVIH